MKFLFICLFIFIIPWFSHAAIVINEVAWMGNEVSANDEWIELHNNGADTVNVDGWVLQDGMNLSIELTGSIAAGQYAVLERTDDSSAPGSAFLVYVGALANTGATLSLYRKDSSLEDRVVGGEDWKGAGGDNVTKETAQYTTSGWITALATPGRTNASVSTEEKEEEVSDEKEKNADDDKVVAFESPLHLTPHTLRSSIEVPTRVYVNQEVSIRANSSGLADVILNSLTHQWNFGDFTTGVGEETTHRFEYSGEYVVTLHSQYKDYEAYARKTVTVLPVSFSMTTNASGDIQVHNDARYEVDISGYTIVAGKTLAFPPRTILLPNATITIPKEILQYRGNTTAALFDDTTILVASISPEVTSQDPVVSQSTQRVTPAMSSTLIPTASSPLSKQDTPPDTFSFADEDTETKATTEATTSTPSLSIDTDKVYVNEGSSQMAAPIEATKSIPEGKLPYFALLAVIGLGITAVFAGKIGT